MPIHADVLKAEKAFFDALVGAQTGDLDDLLTDDFTLADLGGGLMSKGELTEAVRLRRLQFEAIEHVESVVRFHGPTAIVTGRTQLRGSFDGTPFVAHSRYTHVYVEREGKLYLATAQGTPIPSGVNGADTA